jgi:glyoxylase-like metal-dependent hydrolase (beta-lactamase superfamily II)
MTSNSSELLEPGESYEAGSLEFDVIATPGHTPACVTFKFGDAIFTGDALFMPDMGTGRCDFPGGSAQDMYHSIHEVLYALPDDTKVYVGHDYQPGGRDLEYVADLGVHKAENVALPEDRDREDFVQWREERDASLEAPQLLFQSVQVNVDAGALPEPHKNKITYLKIPVNVFRPEPEEEDMSLEDV